MRTKFFPYVCRYVNGEGAWLSAYYDKDFDKRPALARRLHQRYSAMRTARERVEIMKRLKK